jgi:hypothetical protein
MDTPDENSPSADATLDIAHALKRQYHAGLRMFRQAVESCPDHLWTGGDHPNAFWHIAYHTLFYTALYLQPNEDAFEPWEHHREEYQFFGKLPWPPHDPPAIGEPYTRAQILEYWQVCDAAIDATVDELDLTAADCGFWWYDEPKFEHQLINLRHLQHHTAQLADRLRRSADLGVEWVSSALAGEATA